jgi:hypothetical protein
MSSFCHEGRERHEHQVTLFPSFVDDDGLLSSGPRRRKLQTQGSPLRAPPRLMQFAPTFRVPSRRVPNPERLTQSEDMRTLAAMVVSTLALSSPARASDNHDPVDAMICVPVSGTQADQKLLTIVRVRSSDPSLAALIDRAALRSATFKRLHDTIGASGGFVYVEPGSCGHGVRACLKMWMHVSGPNRFLRVVVERRKGDSDAELAGSIGHEMQHAIEALSDSGVTNGVQLYNFFRRYAPTDNKRFETTAAINIGNVIRDELRDKQAEK